MRMNSTGWTIEVIDIDEHLPTLKRYAEQCDRIVEFGVRDGSGSTTAFLDGVRKELISYDVDPGPIGLMERRAKERGIKAEFRQQNVLTADNVPECDLLFIDTYHTAEQLAQELGLHAGKAKKWIILHDTVTFWEGGEDGHKGLKYALEPFLAASKEWQVREVFKNNNGLTVLERV